MCVGRPDSAASLAAFSRSAPSRISSDPIGFPERYSWVTVAESIIRVARGTFGDEPERRRKRTGSSARFVWVAQRLRNSASKPSALQNVTGAVSQDRPAAFRQPEVDPVRSSVSTSKKHASSNMVARPGCWRPSRYRRIEVSETPTHRATSERRTPCMPMRRRRFVATPPGSGSGLESGVNIELTLADPHFLATAGFCRCHALGRTYRQKGALVDRQAVL